MAIGLTFEEYVELKLMPPKHADRAFVTAAEHMRDEAFPMSLAQAAWHVRTRGYDCRPESLELLVKQQTVEPVDVDAWTRADVDAVCDYFEQHGFYVPYAEACRVLGCAYTIGRPQSRPLLRSRIHRVLHIANAMGYESLVLGAWGCGAFGNDPETTAADFKSALAGDFRYCFAEVAFAIADWSPERRFLGPFRDAFA